MCVSDIATITFDAKPFTFRFRWVNVSSVYLKISRNVLLKYELNANYYRLRERSINLCRGNNRNNGKNCNN